MNMYTTPRKVKQESRLRRSLSLTNTNRSNNSAAELDGDVSGAGGGGGTGSSINYYVGEQDGAFGTGDHHHRRGAEQSGEGGGFTPRLDIGQGKDGSTHQSHHREEQPPPYRAPPPHQHHPAGFHESLADLPSSVPERCTYDSHSSKFPIVRQVIFSKESSGATKPEIPTLSQFQKLQAKKITKKIAWTDERKAYTLDSRTAKDFQEHLIFSPSALLRRNSLDLEKFLKVFNEEQSLGMASMQNGRIVMSHGDGLDNPDIVSHAHPHGNVNGIYGSTSKMGMYFPDSSSSQSLSLSSSNADSMDTVIYKGQSQGAPSIRDWQRSMDSSMEYAQRLESNGNIYMDQRSYHMQQNTSAAAYHGLGFNGTSNGGVNGHGNFTMEYHRNSAGNGHQNLSVQAIQPGNKSNLHQENHSHHIRSASTVVQSGVSSSASSQMRNNTGLVSNGNRKNYGGSNPQLAPGKSPVLPQKQTAVTQDIGEHSKKDSKLFHTKTYNHIKDMISSRFGNGSGGGGSAVKMVNNDTKNNNSGSYDQMLGNANVNTSHQSSDGQQHGYGGSSNQSHYYGATGSPTQSPNYPTGLRGMNGGVPPPNSYRSPNMNERKNVNTSFRKAIQQSTQKSNLADDSVPMMMRQIMENGSAQNRDIYGRSMQFSNSQEHLANERAQRALDKLCDPGGPGFNRVESGPMVHSHLSSPGQQSQGLQQASYSRTPQHQERTPNLENAHTRHKFNVKPGGASPNAGLILGDNHVAFTKSALVNGITNEAFQNNDEYNEAPPPLPSSQQPSKQELSNIGLPVFKEKRENGDGSSGSMETKANDPGSSSRESNNQLKQISNDLQHLALQTNEHQSSSSECEKGSQRVGSGQSHTTTDSGHGTVMLAKSPLHSSDPSENMESGPSQRQKLSEQLADSISSGNDSEWVDIVEPEIRQILELERANGKSNASMVNMGPNGQGHAVDREEGNPMLAHPSYASPRSQSSKPPGQGSTSELANSPGLLSKKSPKTSPKNLKKFDLNHYGKKSAEPMPGTSQQAAAALALAGAKLKAARLPAGLHRSNSNSGSGQHRLNGWSSRQRLTNEKLKQGRKESGQHKAGKLTRSAMSQILYSLQDDNGDITSTTTGLDLESMLDGGTECTSDDDDLSTTIDTTDAHAIRRQLESLESMYTEVLKVLGGKKLSGGQRYGSSDLRNVKRRPYGSMSSLPSSVSSRPFREKKKIDDKKKVKDLKSINRRFQRLESHVVTLARSVAHLSSEMRTQHLMVQEMESIRNEMSQLRNQMLKASMQNHGNPGNFARAASGRNGAMPHVSQTDWSSFRNALPSLTNPTRVKKLTKFFGDEPPLIRIFLKKLGYEKYASAFEQERIGIMELPYLTEERLNKMGIPMGPRLRILQEAHSCLKPHLMEGHPSHHANHQIGNLSVYVV